MLGLSLPSAGPMARPLRLLRRILPPLNFITIHYMYFIFTCLLCAVILWGSSTPARKVSFTDSLFLAISAMTEAGLNTVNLSELNTFQQFLLFLLILLGSAIWVSAFVVHVRRQAFTKRMAVVKEERQRKRLERRSTSRMRRAMSWGSRMIEDEGIVKANQPDGEPAKGHINGSIERGETPPGRRGAPEMNGISGTTGEKIDDSEEDRSAQDTIHGISPERRQGITFRDDTRFGPSQARILPVSQAPTRMSTTSGLSHTSTQSRHRPLFSLNGVGANPVTSIRPSVDLLELQRVETSLSQQAPPKNPRGDISKYFVSISGWVARNSQFHGLSSDERELLGGLEYRAVSLLAWLVPLYFVLFQLLGAIGCGAWVAYNMPETARANGLNPWWVGAFNAVSAFNNSGMSLLDANMVAFQKSYYMLLTMSLLILAGNTAYPIFLRLIVWGLWKIVAQLAQQRPQGSVWVEREETLRFLLDHPRRCYTNLFPSQHTWWLAFSVFTLNVVDWAFFEILNINNHSITAGLPLRFRIMDGLFQAFAVRSGGFYVVTISNLRISLLVLYVVMMYISAYPVVITMRNSNVYEERSLGIYAEENDGDDGDDQSTLRANRSPDDEERGRTPTNKTAPPSPSTSPGFLVRHTLTLRNAITSRRLTRESNSHFVRHQLRAQLAHDAWWIVLALFIITICETSSLDAHPVVFSAFNVLFEIVSAYGCVGISVGVPWAAYSFCGAWGTLAKLVLCLVMLRGRHRGLPVAIDKAVLLPGDRKGLGGGVDLGALAEEEDGAIRLARRRTGETMREREEVGEG